MGVVRLSNAGIRDFQKTDSFLAGNTAFSLSAEDFLEEVVLTSATSSVTFDNLDTYSDYEHLQIRSVAAGSGSNFDEITLTFNGDTSSTYKNHYLFGNGSSVSSGNTTDRRIASITSSTSSIDIFGAAVIDILDFSSSAKNTTVRAVSGYEAAAQDRIFLRSLLYVNTDAVTSILIENNDSTNFQVGSRFSLYGAK